MKKQQNDLRIEATKKLLAFSLFREKGMNAVKSMYPDQLEFVEANKEKSVRQVKNDLFGSEKVHA